MLARLMIWLSITVIGLAVLEQANAQRHGKPGTWTGTPLPESGGGSKLKVAPIPYIVLPDDIGGPLKSMQELKRKKRPAR